MQTKGSHYGRYQIDDGMQMGRNNNPGFSISSSSGYSFSHGSSSSSSVSMTQSSSWGSSSSSSSSSSSWSSSSGISSSSHHVNRMLNQPSWYSENSDSFVVKSPNHKYYNYTTEDYHTKYQPSVSYPSKGWPIEPHPVKTLQVKTLDFNQRTNQHHHHTSEYDVSRGAGPLVVRRGKPFEIIVHFNRAYDRANDDLKLNFQADVRKPMKSKGTDVDILLSDADEYNEWGAKIVSNEGSQLRVKVFTPSTVFIGKWFLGITYVEKATEECNNVFSYVHPEPIYILFNPWCQNDEVYMGNQNEINEYVMNEHGVIYQGTSKAITSKPWYFGQFEDGVLDVALCLLERGGLKWEVRGNPVLVVRKLTAMVNAADDSGVLAGNWSGDYPKGRTPLSWTGSPAILQRYYETGRSVNYGQCWVFAGVTTTLMRALGIPARCVTNYSSAHDTDGTVTIDYHFNTMGEPEDALNKDRVWNFHVWNETWMSRPDLPHGYGGWQAIDSTPQETSDGLYVCGPASIKAIREGELNLPYDGKFVFAEVNADIKHWIVSDFQTMQESSVETKSVGKFISTKACNCNDREDITHIYKQPEDSTEEVVTKRKANQIACTAEKKISFTNVPDCTFSLEQDAQNTYVGQDFVVGLHIKNNSSQPRTITGKVVVKVMFYTGVTCETIKSEKISHVIQPGQEYFPRCIVQPCEYIDKLKDKCMLDVSYLASVKETEQIFSAKEHVALQKPKLAIRAPTEAEVGREFTVDISFDNPLDKMLTNCEVQVDGLSRDLTFRQRNVGPKQKFQAQIPITPRRQGYKDLILIFSSSQLDDINISYNLLVKGGTQYVCRKM